MYEKIAAVAPLLKDLNASLRAPDSSKRVASIIEALDETAREISDVTQSTESAEERAALQKIYRGMIAAKRVVAHLHELSPT